MTKLVLKNINNEIEKLIGEIYSFDCGVWKIVSYKRGTITFQELVDEPVTCPMFMDINIWDKKLKEFERLDKVESEINWPSKPDTYNEFDVK